MKSSKDNLKEAYFGDSSCLKLKEVSNLMDLVYFITKPTR
jgi:hypothetical protein